MQARQPTHRLRSMIMPHETWGLSPGAAATPAPLAASTATAPTPLRKSRLETVIFSFTSDRAAWHHRGPRQSAGRPSTDGLRAGHRRPAAARNHWKVDRREETTGASAHRRWAPRLRLLSPLSLLLLCRPEAGGRLGQVQRAARYHAISNWVRNSLLSTCSLPVFSLFTAYSTLSLTFLVTSKRAAKMCFARSQVRASVITAGRFFNW